jgi:hypothetical protein
VAKAEAVVHFSRRMEKVPDDLATSEGPWKFDRPRLRPESAPVRLVLVATFKCFFKKLQKLRAWRNESAGATGRGVELLKTRSHMEIPV